MGAELLRAQRLNPDAAGPGQAPPPRRLHLITHLPPPLPGNPGRSAGIQRTGNRRTPSPAVTPKHVSVCAGDTCKVARKSFLLHFPVFTRAKKSRPQNPQAQTEPVSQGLRVESLGLGPDVASPAQCLWRDRGRATERLQVPASMAAPWEGPRTGPYNGAIIRKPRIHLQAHAVSPGVFLKR